MTSPLTIELAMPTAHQHPLRLIATRRYTPTAPERPTCTGDAQFVVTSLNGRVTVYVAPTLGQGGLQNAQDLVNDADRVAAATYAASWPRHPPRRRAILP